MEPPSDEDSDSKPKERQPATLLLSVAAIGLTLWNQLAVLPLNRRLPIVGVTTLLLVVVVGRWGPELEGAVVKWTRAERLVSRLAVGGAIVTVGVVIALVVAPFIIRIAAPVLHGRTTVLVYGNSSAGTDITLEPGTYTIRYKGGAYSTYPIGASPGFPTWLTSVFVYNGAPQFNPDGSINDAVLEYRLADFKYAATAALAEAKASGFQTEIRVVRTERLVFVAVDYLSAYGDNPGKIIVEVERA